MFKDIDDITRSEYEQYVAIIGKIKEFKNQLEGMEYIPSNHENNFKKCGTFAIVIILFVMVAHQVLKYMRFTQTDW